jgi:heme A synthase
MFTGLLHAHSGLRYLVLLAGVLALGYALWGMVSKRPYDKGMRILGTSFAGLLHLQVLLGFFLLVSGVFQPMLIGHIFLMLIAAVLAQIPVSVMRRRPPEQRSFTPHVVVTLLALALIWMGVASIGRGLLQSFAF